MKISIVQARLAWCDPQSNRNHFNELTGNLPPVDLLVLPEMFSTGFVTRPEGVAEENGEDSLTWMRLLAKEKQCAVAGSLAVRDETGYHNRFYFVKPDGSVVYYDKRHLFTHSGEDRFFTPGNDRVVVEWKGVRILLQVCYDLRFPAFSRNRLVDGTPEYDMILYVASWPEQRSAAWKALLRARAIENQCYVAGVNRVGEDPSNRYSGDSAVFDPYGTELAYCTAGVEEIATAVIDTEALSAFREKFPVLRDADSIEIH